MFSGLWQWFHGYGNVFLAKTKNSRLWECFPGYDNDYRAMGMFFRLRQRIHGYGNVFQAMSMISGLRECFSGLWHNGGRWRNCAELRAETKTGHSTSAHEKSPDLTAWRGYVCTGSRKRGCSVSNTEEGEFNKCRLECTMLRIIRVRLNVIPGNLQWCFNSYVGCGTVQHIRTYSLLLLLLLLLLSLLRLFVSDAHSATAIIIYDLLMLTCFCSPWYNRNGWLGVKHQVTATTPCCWRNSYQRFRELWKMPLRKL